MMNFATSSNNEQSPLSSSSPFLPNSHFQQVLTTCSSFLHNFSSSFTNHLNTHLSNFASTSSSPFKSHAFARIPPLTVNPIKMEQQQQQCGMSNEAIEERLAGVPVYALTNSNEEFVLISGKNSKKSLALFCLKKEDADILLDQLRLMDPDMRRGSSVVPVALNKVFQLKVNGVAFRLLPEASEVKNALKVLEKSGDSEDELLGVPIFQSRSLILSSSNRRYRPVFFRKEDLEKSLYRASKQQGRLNPAFRQGAIEVAVLEDIIKGMKDDSTQKWDDVVFIPPGFDVSTDPSQSREYPAK